MIQNANSIDWKWTIQRNLKNYNTELKKLISERVYFYSRAQRSNSWTVIVEMDQSGSMADSVAYGTVIGSIFASLPALETRVSAFDTEVLDLTEQCGDDPVECEGAVLVGVVGLGNSDLRQRLGGQVIAIGHPVIRLHTQ